MKKTLLLLISIIMILSPMVVSAKGGYDEFGYNDKARMFNGFYGYSDKDIEGGRLNGTVDMWLVMKWSKDWTPMADEPIGAWVTNHITWYSNDYNNYDEDDFYGYDDRVTWNEEVSPEATYRIENFSKIMKVSDNETAWAEYEAAGAIGVWGTYENGVPKYVVFQDVVQVYDTATGELIEEINNVKNVNHGLGNPIF